MAYFQRRRLIVTITAVLFLFVVLRTGQFEFMRDLSPVFQLPFLGPKVQPLPWEELAQQYPVPDEQMFLVPSGPGPVIPKVQFLFSEETLEALQERLQRRDAVKEAFVHSWNGYAKYAWLHDEVTPLSKSYRDPFGGWGATLVDNLDTLHILGMDREFATAVAALKRIDFSRPSLTSLNVFETTIRYLGGMLSAYDLSGGKYPILREKATQLGEMLYHAFDTPNRMPTTRWDWQSKGQGQAQTASGSTLSAEIGSLSLEFTRLSQITNDPKYFDAIQRITNELEKAQKTTKIPGLWPVVIDAETLKFDQGTFTFGGMSDSMYEYLPKQHLLLGGQTTQHHQMYTRVLQAAKESLFFRPYNHQNLDILISGTSNRGSRGAINFSPQGQHLTCFAGGMVAIGAKIFSTPEELMTARRLVEGCIWASNVTASGLMPEIFRAVPCEAKDCSWSQAKYYETLNEEHNLDAGQPEPATKDERAELLIRELKLPIGMTYILDKRYLLRPEVVESLFIMYRVTGEKYYQDVAWRLFEKICQVCRTDIGYAGIYDVLLDEKEREERKATAQIDSSESFWMAETLKYLYLIFSEPELVDLDEFVL